MCDFDEFAKGSKIWIKICFFISMYSNYGVGRCSNNKMWQWKQIGHLTNNLHVQLGKAHLCWALLSAQWRCWMDAHDQIPTRHMLWQPQCPDPPRPGHLHQLPTCPWHHPCHRSPSAALLVQVGCSKCCLVLQPPQLSWHWVASQAHGIPAFNKDSHATLHHRK